MAKVKTRRFTVRGRGQFPIDMLRYDSCWPYTSMDSSYISDESGGREVTLLTNSPNAPTHGRWKSFTWAVVEGD